MSNQQNDIFYENLEEMKPMRLTIEQIAYNLDGKRFLEGKISRDPMTKIDMKNSLVVKVWCDVRQAERENEEVEEYKRSLQPLIF